MIRSGKAESVASGRIQAPLSRAGLVAHNMLRASVDARPRARE
jgi:hypothetical protein